MRQISYPVTQSIDLSGSPVLSMSSRYASVVLRNSTVFALFYSLIAICLRVQKTFLLTSQVKRTRNRVK